MPNVTNIYLITSTIHRNTYLRQITRTKTVVAKALLVRIKI